MRWNNGDGRKVNGGGCGQRKRIEVQGRPETYIRSDHLHSVPVVHSSRRVAAKPVSALDWLERRSAISSDIDPRFRRSHLPEPPGMHAGRPADILASTCRPTHHQLRHRDSRTLCSTTTAFEDSSSSSFATSCARCLSAAETVVTRLSNELKRS